MRTLVIPNIGSVKFSRAARISIVEWLASVGMEVFPPAIYSLSEIPHRIIASDVWFTVGIVYVFGLLASLVPAALAASKDPVSALNE